MRALVLLVLVVLVVAGFLLFSPAAPSAPAVGPPVASPTSTAMTSVVMSRTTVDASDELVAALDDFLGAIPVTPQQPEIMGPPPPGSPGPRDVWQEAKSSGASALDFGRDLDAAIRAHGPAEAAELLLEGLDGADDETLFVAARTLAQRIDRPSALRLLEGMPDAPPAARKHLIFALRGSAEPEVDQALVDFYSADEDPVVRARAGFALGDRVRRLEPALRDRALGQAREGLQDAEPEQFEAAADVLGGSDLVPRDRSLLEAVVTTGTDPKRRTAALRALATSGLSPADLTDVLQRVRDDPTAGDELQSMARQLLGG